MSFVLAHIRLLSGRTHKNINSSFLSRLRHTTVFSASSQVNRFTERTHTCGELSIEDVGRRVELTGWVQYTKYDNKIIVVRDSYGATQCILDRSKIPMGSHRIPNESVIKISGVVRERPTGQANLKMSTGEVEVATDKLEVLSHASSRLPILTRDMDASNLVNRLKYRYLDLRSKEMQHSLRLRSKACKIIRDKLTSLDFIECETPTLFNRTPGGANEFIVPTRTSDMYYSLVQSPQQLKQLLMIGGLDRYFQICRCYRDEAGRSDRQPEFTQVDIELSFTNQEAVMELTEELMKELLVNIANDIVQPGKLTSSFDINKKFARIKYSEALKLYGTDKPDIRFESLIQEAEDGGLYFIIPQYLDEADLATIVDRRQSNCSIIAKCCSNQGIIVKSHDRSEEARKLLGILRKNIADELDSRGRGIFRSKFAFIWVTDFPLFVQDESNNLQTNHHPFTAPTQDTLSLLEEDPLKVVGQHYDLVLNGQEIAGGSIRINDPVLQEKIFKDLLKVKAEMFDYFIKALGSGCPPHGGLAIGLDRTIAILLDKHSIRDVIAFPKAANGRDLLANCPHELSSDVKSLYHIG